MLFKYNIIITNILMSSNLYETLNLNKSATTDDIKKAYKKLAIKWHPDKCTDPNRKSEYETKFKQISEAHIILSDETKRRIYDQTNSTENIDEMAKQQEMFQGSGMPPDLFGFMQGMQGMQGMNGFPGFQGFPGMHPGMNRNMRQDTIRFTPDVIVSVRIKLEDIYTGKLFKEKINRLIVKINNGVKEEINESEEITFNIDAGFNVEQKLCIQNKGNILFNNDQVIKIGNIVIVFEEIVHPVFKRDNNSLHLFMNYKISIFQSLLGEFNILFTGIDGEKCNFNIEKMIIKPDSVISIQNKGMKCNKEIGNLFINFDIEFPNELSDEQRTTIKQISNYVDVKNKNNTIKWTLINKQIVEEIINKSNEGTNPFTNQSGIPDIGMGENIQCATH